MPKTPFSGHPVAALPRAGLVGLLGVVWLLSTAQPAHPGPLRDRLAERRQANEDAELTQDAQRDLGRKADHVALPPGVQPLRNQAYGPAPDQRLDVYLPPTGAAPTAGKPLLFLVHGGAWKTGDKAAAAVVNNKLAHWSARGVVVVSVNHRMRPEVDPLVQAQDVARALAHVQKHAHEWGADATRIVAMGHSAGAHLVSLLASAPDLAKAAGAAPVRGTVALDSAAFDVPAIMNAWHLPLYDNAFGADPGFWPAASPLHRLTQAGAPLMAVCSTRRKTACEQAHAYQAHAQKLGMRVTVLGQDLSHHDINDQLGLPGPYTDAVDAFMRSLDAGFGR